MSKKPDARLDEAAEMTEKLNIAGTPNVNKEAAGSATSVNDKVEYLEPPVESHRDDFVYRVLKLQNGLTILLISRPRDEGSCKLGKRDGFQGNENAASPSGTSTDGPPGTGEVSLTIDVGCLSDSAEFPCIAELLSRVVLTASKKYPMSYDFKRFLAMHRCCLSTYCNNERTSFSFATEGIHLRETLHRFINCFIEPLLKAEVVEIEKQLKSDTVPLGPPARRDRVDSACTRARDHLFSTLASKCDDNPARHLVPGRHKVLSSQSTDTLLKEIEKFMKRHYSAHRMMASLNAQLSLDELEEYAKTYFSQIPSNGLPPIDFTPFTFDKCFDSPEFRMIYEIQASCRLIDHRLELNWSMPPATRVYKSKPTKYLSWMLQQSDEGSLVWYLRKKNWCTDLRCATGNTCLEPNSIFSLFSLNLTVTDEGHKNYKKVLDAVYSYIKLKRSEGPQRQIYEKIRKQLDREFNCDDKYYLDVCYIPVDLTMHDYASADYLNGGVALLEYDPAAIKQCLELMSPEKANIIVCQKKFGTNHSLSENWEEIRDRVENVKYRKSTIPAAWINRWKNAEPLPEFKLTVVDDTTILEPEDSHKYPMKIHSDDLCEVYQLGTEFPNETNIVKQSYCTPLVTESAENAYMLDVFGLLLYRATVEDELMPGIFSVFNLGFVSQVTSCDTGLIIQVSGRGKNLLRPMENIAERAATVANHVTKHAFDETKKLLFLRYSRDFSTSDKLANEVMLGIEIAGRWSSLEKYHASSRVDFKKFHRFVKHFGDHIFVKCLAQGDFIGSEVIATVRSCVRVLKSRPALPHSLPQKMLHVFPPGTRCCRFQSVNTDDVTAVINHYQFDERSTKQSAVVKLLFMTIIAPTLQLLRARQTLDDYKIRPVLNMIGSYGYSLVTEKSQGQTITRVATIDATIEAFREALNRWFEDLTTLEWEKVKGTFERMTDPTSWCFEQVVESNWREIQSGAYVFNRLARERKVLNELPVEDLRRSMMHLTSNDPSIRKLSVQAVSRREYAARSANARQAPSPFRLNLLTNLPGEEVKSDDYYITDLGAYTRGLTTLPFPR